MPRRVMVFLHSTLDGIVTGDPDGDKADFAGAWAREANLTGKASEALAELFERADTILLGRASYELLSGMWPNVDDSADEITAGLAAKINEAKKLVATRDQGASELPWGDFDPARSLIGDAVETVSGLKTDEGGDVVLLGSPSLVRDLLAASLIDEFHVVVHPAIAGVGDRAFDGATPTTHLVLDRTLTLEDGAVLVSYHRAVADGSGPTGSTT